MALQTQLYGAQNFSPSISVHEVSQKKEKHCIPLVHHIINDDDVDALAGEKINPIDLNRVLKILTDTHYAGLYDRHVLAIHRLLKHYSCGFLMKDLVKITKLLTVCADKIEEGHAIYVGSLIDTLRICALPFLMEKASDEITYKQICVETISQFGYLMRLGISEVRLQICRSLLQIYCGKHPPRDLQSLKAASNDYNKGLCEESDISRTLVRTLHLLDNDLAVRLAVINLLQKLSAGSESCCQQMIEAEGALILCNRLMDHDPSGELIFRSVEVIWNLLQTVNTNDVTQQLASQSCIEQLRDAFLYLIPRTFSTFDRQLRNDILVLVQLLAARDCRAPFLETSFLKQLTLLATFEEVKSHNPLVKNLKLTKNHEDFELKKLLVNTLIILSEDPSVLPVLSEGHLMLALLSFVRPNETAVKQSDKLPPAYFEEMQLLALSALCTLGPKLINDFISCNGVNRLLQLLLWSIDIGEDYRGHGNAFHGSGGRGSKRAQMRRCLRALRAIISTNHYEIITDLVDQGAIHSLSDILTSANKSSQSDDSVDLEMKSDMLCILSSLCENSLHSKEIFGTDGVDNLIHFLKIDTILLSSGLGHYQLMISAIDAVWCCVIGSFIVEDYFLEKEGVYLLLDLLENSPSDLYNLILGVLLDLSENEKSLPHIKTWRGKSDMSAPHLLCVLWRDAEDNLECLRKSDGSISDLRHPLMGKNQRESTTVPVASNLPSKSIIEVSENLRSKIYAVFCKIGYIDLPGITADDHVSLTIIERYLDYKLGEVWHEIEEELNAEDVRPITPDMEALEWITRCTEEETLLVARTQSELIEAKKQQDLSEEFSLYSELRENHRQKEKEIQDFEDYVARTSNYEKLKEVKQKQLQSIEASRIVARRKDDVVCHPTSLTNLQSTVFCNRTVTVESTPPEILGGHLDVKDRLSSWMNHLHGPTTRSPTVVTGRSVELLD